MDESMENTLKDIIIPDLEKLLSIEYSSDDEIIKALDQLEEKWRSLSLPAEYNEALTMFVSSKYSLQEIFSMLPYIHIYVYTMKLITYLFFQSRKFDTEISLISSLNQICIDKAENKDAAEYILEHINYVQDITMLKDKSKEQLLQEAVKENAAAFKEFV